jgi:hypothetical protein
MNKKNWLYGGFFALVLASNICAAQGSSVDAIRSDIATRKAEMGNLFAGIISDVVHPVGTRFTITALHPAGAQLLSTFAGKVATAATCTGDYAGVTDPGINILTGGSRVGYYDACFYLDGDSRQYYVYGFLFNLVNSTPTPTCTSPQVLQNGQCVTPTPTCYSPQVLENGQCVTPAPTCYSPQVLQNGQCVTLTPTCTSSQILQNGQCVTLTPTCTSPQVLQDGKCVTPTPTTTTSGATYSNGILTIKRLEIDNGALGKTYYDVTMTLKALSNPLTFVVDSAVPAK